MSSNTGLAAGTERLPRNSQASSCPLMIGFAAFFPGPQVVPVKQRTAQSDEHLELRTGRQAGSEVLQGPGPELSGFELRQRVLELVHERPGIDEYDIAVALGVPISSVFRTCDELHRDGKIKPAGEL